MGMMNVLKAIFTGGGGAVQSIERVASEWIETSQETAEAEALMIKTLDPNGAMRRDQSNRILALYSLYVKLTIVLILLEAFGVGPVVGPDGTLAVSMATEKIKDLFAPLTTLNGVIIAASFGVNYANVKRGK